MPTWQVCSRMLVTTQRHTPRHNNHTHQAQLRDSSVRVRPVRCEGKSAPAGYCQQRCGAAPLPPFVHNPAYQISCAEDATIYMIDNSNILLLFFRVQHTPPSACAKPPGMQGPTPYTTPATSSSTAGNIHTQINTITDEAAHCHTVCWTVLHHSGSNSC